MRVRGIGPVPCDFCIVGEGPGYHEAQSGRPFVGKTGAELNRFLDGYHLPAREDVFLTNVYRQYMGKDYVYTTDDLARDEPELIDELRRVQPKLIVPLGRYATRWFLGDVDVEDVHALPWYWSGVGRLGGVQPDEAVLPVVFPIFHPAAGFHNPEVSGFVSYGFAQLADYLKGILEPRLLYDDPYPKPMYELLTGDEVWGILEAL